MDYYENNNQQFIQGHYLSLKGVNVELSEKYKCPDLISLPYDYIITNDKIISENNYDFSKEINYMKEFEENKKIEEQKKKIEEQKKIEELKSKAPGLSDKVLEPIKINQQAEQIEKGISEDIKEKEETNQSTICISEFEAVPPIDPWERSKTDKEELFQLQMEMSEMTCSQNNTNNLNKSPEINRNPQIFSSPSLQSTSPGNQNNISQPNNISPLQLQQQNQPNNLPQIDYNAFPYNTSAQNIPSYLFPMPTPSFDKSNDFQQPPPLPDRPTLYQQQQVLNNTSPKNELIDTIVGMGFSREIVSRGYRLCGNNKQKIIDYSINYTYFENEGYKPKYIETAISLYDVNKEKCEKFLESFVKLIEMGFDQEEIKEALLFSENDSEIAIDQLTKQK